MGTALFGEVGLVGLFLDGEKQFLLLGVQFLLRLVGEQLSFVALHQLLIAGLLEDAHEAFGARLAEFGSVQQHADLLFQIGGVLGRDAVFRAQLGNEGLGFAQEAVAKFLLGLDQPLDRRLELDELLVHRHDRGTRDDQRRSRFIDEDGIYFVHDGEIVAPLDLLFFAGGHAIVAQVVEAELGVGAVGDVTLVHLPTHRRRLVMQNAADAEA